MSTAGAFSAGAASSAGAAASLAGAAAAVGAAPPESCSRASSSGERLLVSTGAACSAGAVVSFGAGTGASSAAACVSSVDSVGTSASTMVRNWGLMSYQPMSSDPANSTRAWPLMFTVFTCPVSPANRLSSGIEPSTWTNRSVHSRCRPVTSSRSDIRVSCCAASPTVWPSAERLFCGKTVWDSRGSPDTKRYERIGSD